MPSPDADNEPVEQASAPVATRWERLRERLRAPAVSARAHPRTTIALAVTTVLLAAGSAAAWVWLRPAPFDAARSAETALERLDEGEFDEAKKLAEEIHSRTEASEPLAVASFVLGATGVKEAEGAARAAKRPLFLLAAHWLQDALARGLPDDRCPEAQWLLGRSLYDAGQFAASQPALEDAVAAQPQRATLIRQLLAEAYLRDCPPRLAEAAEQNQLVLADQSLPASQRLDGLFQKAEILVAMGKPEECLSVLAAIPPDAQRLPAANVLRGRAWLQEAQALNGKGASAASQPQIREKLQAALSALNEAQESDPTRSSTSARQALYLAGLCHLELGDTAGALDLFGQLRSAEPYTPEFLAAAFQEGNVLRALKRETEAATAYGRALDAARAAEEFQNPWVSLDQFRDRVLDAYRLDMESRNFAAAFELARRAEGALPSDRAIEMRAETCRDWGRDLVAQAENAQPAKAADLAREGRRQLRRASRFWQQLAQCRDGTRFFPEDLWESAVCALEGHDYRSAVSLFDQYMKADPRGRQPKAYTDLGEALLCLGRIDEAIEALRACIERHSRDAAVPRARLLASRACLEKGDVAGARRLLEENLSGQSLTPASREYRESLFALGRLLHQTQQYEEALAPLEEAAHRYADLRQTIEAQYLIADCHRRKALAEEEKLRHDLVEQSRGARRQRIKEAVTAALQWQRQAQQTLLKRQQTAPLDPLEELMLRNSCYFIGSLLSDLGQYDAAVAAYTEAANRYPAAPETLEAYVQIARAFRAADKRGEARGAIERAKHLLARIKPETPFEQTTNYTKSQWAARLERLSAM